MADTKVGIMPPGLVSLVKGLFQRRALIRVVRSMIIELSVGWKRPPGSNCWRGKSARRNLYQLFYHLRLVSKVFERGLPSSEYFIQMSAFVKVYNRQSQFACSGVRMLKGFTR